MIKTETRGAAGTGVAACEFCGALCSAEGGSVRHTRSCESGIKSERWTPAVASAPIVETAVLAIGRSVPLNAVGNGEAEDRFHAVNSRNPRDWNRAMNRDD